MGLRRRLTGLYALLALLNGAAWVWAALALHGRPLLLGTALLAYGFGLRHAVDADHIAAIDNVTRKLMADGKRPVSVGLFFALGHSAVVVLLTALVVGTAGLLEKRFGTLEGVGDVLGAVVSALFLFAIAAMNLVILGQLWRGYRAARRGEVGDEAALARLLDGRGLLTRLLRPVFGLVSASWHMLPVGFLFGLGFDTATEVSLLGMSAAQASHGMPLVSVLVFPALFAAGMALVDTTDGVLMLGAYEWALVRPLRKLGYNLAITAMSVVLAVVIGGIEVLGLLGDRLGLQGSGWAQIERLNDRFPQLGAVVVGLFAVSWAASFLLGRFRQAGRVDAEP